MPTNPNTETLITDEMTFYFIINNSSPRISLAHQMNLNYITEVYLINHTGFVFFLQEKPYA